MWGDMPPGDMTMEDVLVGMIVALAAWGLFTRIRRQVAHPRAKKGPFSSGSCSGVCASCVIHASEGRVGEACATLKHATQNDIGDVNA